MTATWLRGAAARKAHRGRRHTSGARAGPLLVVCRRTGPRSYDLENRNATDRVLSLEENSRQSSQKGQPLGQHLGFSSWVSGQKTQSSHVSPTLSPTGQRGDAPVWFQPESVALTFLQQQKKTDTSDNL